jgi:hypothetical protein
LEDGQLLTYCCSVDIIDLASSSCRNLDILVQTFTVKVLKPLVYLDVLAPLGECSCSCVCLPLAEDRSQGDSLLARQDESSPLFNELPWVLKQVEDPEDRRARKAGYEREID